ncbi:MAG: DUF177 domain-containing protein [Phyllobacteriaceae bacterium]|nr:DUF177 domain-containing protein [Phyllobacteriaceae bacterium]
MTSSPSLPELLVSPARLPKKGERFAGALSPAQCAAVAADLGIVSVESMSWELVAKPWKRNGFELRGKVEGAVTQACVVTVEPVPETIHEEIDLRFLPANAPHKPVRKTDEESVADIVFNAEPEDEPELFETDPHDVMPLAVEHLALGLDPYPRKPEVADARPVVIKTEEEESALARALRNWVKPE